jgi:uncharacterized OB-fold protein
MASFSVEKRQNGNPGPILYGLPCAKCGVYYDSALTACPICGSTEHTSAQDRAISRLRLRESEPQ